jgi:hypothetical protein
MVAQRNSNPAAPELRPERIMCGGVACTFAELAERLGTNIASS